MQSTDTLERFIGPREVQEIAGYSESTLERKIKAGTFPQPVIHESRTRRWSFLEVRKWQADQLRKRDERLKAAAQSEAVPA